MTDLNFSIQELVIATRDVDGAAARFGSALAAPIDGRVTRAEDGIGIDMTGVWVGDFRIAFVGDSTGSGSVARFLDKRGEGVLEICLRTSDLKAAMAKLKSAGFTFTSEEPHSLKHYEWQGEVFSEVLVVFVHPASACGVQIELQQWVK
ncbi:MAG: VOC family protein [Actinomycetota bacterium]|nr:VOC family protein [Actinomycetota bacterium]